MLGLVIMSFCDERKMISIILMSDNLEILFHIFCANMVGIASIAFRCRLHTEV